MNTPLVDIIDDMQHPTDEQRTAVWEWYAAKIAFKTEMSPQKSPDDERTLRLNLEDVLRALKQGE